MIHNYLCEKCLEDKAGKPLRSLSMVEYAEFSGQFVFPIEHAITAKPSITCPVCHSDRIRKHISLGDSYTRGYGMLDKKGVRSDVNLFMMTNGVDPYKEHRKVGDNAEIINKLRQDKNYKPKRTDIHV